MVFGCFFHVFGTKAGVPHVGGEIVKISQKINALYHEYTDYVEPASIDESYLDMTGALMSSSGW